MSANRDHVSQREKTAMDAIKRTFGTVAGEFGATLFASHHLDELAADYWQMHLGTAKPDPEQVLDILTLKSHWGSEDENEIDVFDFTLPGDVTNYVISVRFDDAGEVEDISMES